MERLDGWAPDAGAGVESHMVIAGEGHAGHADQGSLLDLCLVQTRAEFAEVRVGCVRKGA
jgi:hypothetical protein